MVAVGCGLGSWKWVIGGGKKALCKQVRVGAALRPPALRIGSATIIRGYLPRDFLLY